jgi:hypothetical protein
MSKADIGQNFSQVRFRHNAAPHTLDSNQQRFLITLTEKLISNLRMQIALKCLFFQIINFHLNF